MNDFYVYLHRRRDDRRVFYIGMGRGDRAKNFIAGRTREWTQMAATHGVDIEYVKFGLHRDEALVLECREIAKFLEAGAELVNVKNLFVACNVREHGRAYDGGIFYKWRNIVVPTIVCATLLDMVTKYGANLGQLSDVLDGKSVITDDGWVTGERQWI